MLSCKELALAVTSDEDAEASWRRRLEIRLHLFLCRPCRVYARQVRKVGRLASSLWCESCADDDAALERLEKRICGQIDAAAGQANGSSQP